MQFDGLEPLREGLPTIQIVSPEGTFDLHNDADIREIALDFQEKELRVGWIVKEAAWTDPGHPETRQRRTVAGVVLGFAGVRSVVMSGGFLNVAPSDDRTIGFLEYNRLGQGLGRVRIVLENEAEIAIIASRCQLVTMNKT